MLLGAVSTVTSQWHEWDQQEGNLGSPSVYGAGKLEQSENEAERPWGEKEGHNHQEREASGEAKEKENHNVGSKDKFTLICQPKRH